MASSQGLPATAVGSALAMKRRWRPKWTKRAQGWRSPSPRGQGPWQLNPLHPSRGSEGLSELTEPVAARRVERGTRERVAGGEELRRVEGTGSQGEGVLG